MNSNDTTIRKMLRRLETGTDTSGSTARLPTHIIQQHICKDEWVGNLVREMQTLIQESLATEANPDARYEKEFFLKHLKASDIKELLFLFTVGNQLTANKEGDYYPRGVTFSGQAHAAAHYDVDSDILNINPTLFYQYVILKYADQATNDNFRKLHLPKQDTLILDEITRGAEEAYHCIQWKNSSKRDILVAAMEKPEVYGKPWRKGRGETYMKAIQSGRAAVAAFYANDPFEVDGDGFKERIKEKIMAASERYLQGLGTLDKQ